MVSAMVVRKASRSIVGARIAGVSIGVAAPGRAAHSPTPLPLTAGGLRAQVSRDEPLPGGYKRGDKVFFTGSSRTWDDGDKLVHGQQGEVMGPGTSSKRTAGEGVVVRFPGNTRLVGCFVTEVRPPPRRPRSANPHAYVAPHCKHAAPRPR